MESHSAKTKWLIKHTKLLLLCFWISLSHHTTPSSTSSSVQWAACHNVTLFGSFAEMKTYFQHDENIFSTRSKLYYMSMKDSVYTWIVLGLLKTLPAFPRLPFRNCFSLRTNTNPFSLQCIGNRGRLFQGRPFEFYWRVMPVACLFQTDAQICDGNVSVNTLHFGHLRAKWLILRLHAVCLWSLYLYVLF